MDLRHELNGLWATEKLLICRVRREGSGYSGVNYYYDDRHILVEIKRENLKKCLFNSL